MHSSARILQLHHEKWTPVIEKLGSVFGNDVKDGIGPVGALDAVVDEVMLVSGSVSGDRFGALRLGAHDEEGAEVNETVERAYVPEPAQVVP